ncbi:hypothetical protein GCM10010260_08160 [Streptomyces filipinensis]|uniref:Uncharacterized protein n=1 Tax=Streptomyces filipinensis TaxID=66887 RepID=A0A918I5P8_9ACTN|nr:hypothetical protein GCM10010260_08160 [Streptomyces filipinensis]
MHTPMCPRPTPANLKGEDRMNAECAAAYGGKGARRVVSARSVR